MVGLVGTGIDLLVGGGPAGVVLSFLLGGLGAGLGYWKSDAVVLAVCRARPAEPASYPRLHNLVEGLCVAAGLAKPRVYVIDDEAPNAFAVGRSPRHAAIACTTGLLDAMSRIELEGVLAHELSHVKSYDVLVSTVAVTLLGGLTLLSDAGLRLLSRGAWAAVGALGAALVVTAPLDAQLLRLAVNGRREGFADVNGVRLTRYPPGLISALEKLEMATTVVQSSSRATDHLWIESPLARGPWLNRLFDTHPPLAERIQILKEL